MRYVLFAIEDEGMLLRLRDVFVSNKQVSYFFAGECDEATNFCEENELSVAVLSLSMPVMNGDELAEMIIGRNPSVKFIFLYEQRDIELAIQMFNTYSDCKTIDRDLFNTEDFSMDLDDLLNTYRYDDALIERFKDQNQKERAYKQSIGNMSAVLESRKKCNQQIFEVYLLCSRMMFEDKDDKSLLKVSNFFRAQLETYQSMYLFDEYNIPDEFLRNLVNRFNRPEDKKLFKLDNTAELPAGEISYPVLFMMCVICSAFFWFMEYYRAKVEIRERSDCYILNVIYDITYGREDVRAWGYVCSVLDELCNAFCKKYEVGIKEGIMQYRLVFAQRDTAEEAANE